MVADSARVHLAVKPLNKGSMQFPQLLSSHMLPATCGLCGARQGREHLSALSVVVLTPFSAKLADLATPACTCGPRAASTPAMDAAARCAAMDNSRGGVKTRELHKGGMQTRERRIRARRHVTLTSRSVRKQDRRKV